MQHSSGKEGTGDKRQQDTVSDDALCVVNHVHQTAQLARSDRVALRQRVPLSKNHMHCALRLKANMTHLRAERAKAMRERTNKHSHGAWVTHPTANQKYIQLQSSCCAQGPTTERVTW